MALEQSTESLESALNSAFGDGLVDPPKAPEPEPEVTPEEALPEGEAPEEVTEEEEVVDAPIAEPEFEIEVSGKRHVVRGESQIRELLQKGADYSQKSEQNARLQDALVAKANSVALNEKFQAAISDDMAMLKALDRSLEQYNAVNWAEKFDSDPIEAMKLHAARQELRDARNQKFQEVSGKWEQFQQGQAYAARQVLVAESEALLTKVPEWRNAETAAKEKSEIAKLLTDRYGFNPNELDNLLDHRALLVARDALRYRQMQAVKDDKVKQARAAPPVVKPGTTQKTTSAKQDFVKVRAHLRQLGSKGNHKAQEALVTEMFSKTFKI